MISRKCRLTNSSAVGVDFFAQMAMKAQRFDSKILLSYKDRSANAKSVLELYHLELLPGAEVVFMAEGPKAFEVFEEFEEYFQRIVST